MAKRKYTKRNKDYWENRTKESPKSQSSQSSNNETSILDWEPLDTSPDYASRWGRNKSESSSSSGGRTSTRKNRIAFSSTPDRYGNIDELELPYVTRHSDGTISIQDAALLCQKLMLISELFAMLLM